MSAVLTRQRSAARRSVEQPRPRVPAGGARDPGNAALAGAHEPDPADLRLRRHRAGLVLLQPHRHHRDGAGQAAADGASQGDPAAGNQPGARGQGRQRRPRARRPGAGGARLLRGRRRRGATRLQSRIVPRRILRREASLAVVRARGTGLALRAPEQAADRVAGHDTGRDPRARGTGLRGRHPSTGSAGRQPDRSGRAEARRTRAPAYDDRSRDGPDRHHGGARWRCAGR